MGKAYFWKTRFILLDEEVNTRYNFRIYKKRGKYVQRLCIGVYSFLKEILDTVDKEEIYLKPEDINFKPPPRFKFAKEVKEECPLTREDIEKIFNAWI